MSAGLGVRPRASAASLRRTSSVLPAFAHKHPASPRAWAQSIREGRSLQQRHLTAPMKRVQEQILCILSWSRRHCKPCGQDVTCFKPVPSCSADNTCRDYGESLQRDTLPTCRRRRAQCGDYDARHLRAADLAGHAIALRCLQQEGRVRLLGSQPRGPHDAVARRRGAHGVLAGVLVVQSPCVGFFRF